MKDFKTHFSLIILVFFILIITLPNIVVVFILITAFIYGIFNLCTKFYRLFFSKMSKNSSSKTDSISIGDYIHTAKYYLSYLFPKRTQLESLLDEKEQDLHHAEESLRLKENEYAELMEKYATISDVSNNLYKQISNFEESIHLMNKKHNSIVETYEAEQAKYKAQALLSQVGLFPNLNLANFDADVVFLEILQKMSDYFQIFMDPRLLLYGRDWFHFFEYNCLTSKFPFSMNTLIPYLEKYEQKFDMQKGLYFIDSMKGQDFEYWCADFLRKTGYENVVVTKGSGDKGVDVTAEKDGTRYAIQCKRYESKLGLKPIQEVFAGLNVYGCDIGAVMTNSYFTSQAVELANANGVLLWDKDEIKRMLSNISLT